MKACLYAWILVALVKPPFSQAERVTLDFSSGVVLEEDPFNGVLKYEEDGILVTSDPYPDYPFFLETGELNLALESDAVVFSTERGPFSVISVVLVPGWGVQHFESSAGGVFDVDSSGLVAFPQTSDWKNLMAFRWNPVDGPIGLGFGLMDDLTLDVVPEPNVMFPAVIAGILVVIRNSKCAVAAQPLIDEPAMSLTDLPHDFADHDPSGLRLCLAEAFCWLQHQLPIMLASCCREILAQRVRS